MPRSHVFRALSACTLMLCMLDTPAAQAQDRPFSIKIQGDYFIATGVVDRRTPNRIAKAINENKSIKTLVLLNVPGSDNDEANLRASLMVAKAGLTTVVPAKGLVASGGTDMFLAGKRRIIKKGACIGVHSWASGNRQGADFSDNSSAHDPYLKYYKAIGIKSDFYWFTLDMADADEMHWMSVAELNEFKVATSRQRHGGESEDRRYARCDKR